jgi:hypothetical protein
VNGSEEQLYAAVDSILRASSVRNLPELRSETCEEGPAAVCEAAVVYRIAIERTESTPYGVYVTFHGCRPVFFAGAGCIPRRGWVLRSLTPCGNSFIAEFAKRSKTYVVNFDALRWRRFTSE